MGIQLNAQDPEEGLSQENSASVKGQSHQN